MLGAIKEYTGIDFNEYLTAEEAIEQAKKWALKQKKMILGAKS